MGFLQYLHLQIPFHTGQERKQAPQHRSNHEPVIQNTYLKITNKKNSSPPISA